MKIALIGSGISSIGAMLALQKHKDIKIDHFIGSKQKNLINYKYENGQPASCISYGGLSSYWHGVIPISKEHISIENFKYIFNKLYPNSLEQNYELFVPIKPIRGINQFKNFQKLYTGEYNKIDALVEELDQYDEKINVKYSKNIIKSYDMVILAIGDIEASFLLDLNDDVVFYDHVNGYLGQVNEPLFNSRLSTKLNKKGHCKKILHETNDNLLFSRPVISSTKTVQSIDQLNFGLRSSDVILSLLKNLSFNKLNEAIYNRFGFQIFKTNKISIHYQKTVNAFINKEKKEVKLEFNDSDFSYLMNSFKKNFDFKSFQECKFNFYPGTHIRARLKTKNTLKPNLITCFQNDNNVLSPYHHSFKKLVKTYNDVTKFIKNYNE